MRELPGYRDTLAALETSYPGQLMFSVKEVAVICGVSEDTVRRRVPMNKALHRIARHDLARFLCGAKS